MTSWWQRQKKSLFECGRIVELPKQRLSQHVITSEVGRSKTVTDEQPVWVLFAFWSSTYNLVMIHRHEMQILVIFPPVLRFWSGVYMYFTTLCFQLVFAAPKRSKKLFLLPTRKSLDLEFVHVIMKKKTSSSVRIRQIYIQHVYGINVNMGVQINSLTYNLLSLELFHSSHFDMNQ